MLFLSLFVISQVAIAFLGEGIRDLSKQLEAAQLALDLLALTLLGHAALWIRARRQVAPSHPAADTASVFVSNS